MSDTKHIDALQAAQIAACVQVEAHVQFCARCTPQAPDPHWLSFVFCPAGLGLAMAWRGAEKSYLEEVLKLDLDGDLGGEGRG